MRWKYLSFMALVALFLCCSVMADQPLPAQALLEVSNQAGGAMSAAVGGDPIYLAQGRRIHVIAGGGEGAPDLVHTTGMLGGMITSLERIGDLLVVGWRSAEGLGILSWYSLADPLQPEWLHDFAYKGNESARPVDLVLVDNTLYVMDWPTGPVFPPPLLYPIDVSDPTSPVAFDPVTLGGRDPTLTVFNDQYLLVSSTSSGVESLTVSIIDISRPHVPEQVASYFSSGNAGGRGDVVVADDYIVLLGPFNTNVVSLADPTDPELLSLIPVWSLKGLVADDHLLLFPIDGAARPWDLSDPSSPVELAAVEVASEWPRQVATVPSGDHVILFYADGAAQVVDVSVPSSPVAVAQIPMPGASQVLHIEATSWGAATLDFHQTLRLYGPELDPIPVDSSAFAPQPYSQLAVRPDGLGLLFGDFIDVVDLSQVTQPRLLGQLSMDNLPTLFDPTIDGDRAWAVGGPNIVEFEFADPSNPSIVQVVESGEFSSADKLAFSNDHLYVKGTGIDRGLYIYDVNNDPLAQLVSQYQDCPGINAISVAGGRAVIPCSSDRNWQLLDVTMPEDPVLLATFASPDVIAGETIRTGGSSALLQDEHAWLGFPDYVDLVDLGDPRSVFLIARFHVPGGAADLAPAPDGAWVAAGHGGLARLRLPDPLTPGQTAAWYDPERAGEGWIVEMLDEDRAVGYWFTYDEQGNQRWLIGSGEVRANLIVFDMQDVHGARFGSGFDPEAVEFTPAGTVRMIWTGCDRGWFQFVPDQGGELAIGLERLTRTLALEHCTAPGETDGAARQSGSWYDPAFAGQGFTVHRLDNDRALVYWFTFDSQGNPYWIFGVGEDDGERIVFDEMTAARGARFGEAFDPADVELFAWGELDMKLECLTGTAEYVSVLPQFGSGSFELERLTIPAGLSCD